MSTTNLGIIKSEVNPLTGTKVQLNTGGWFIAESSAVQKSKIESNKTQTITENGTGIEITPSSGKEAMEKVTLTVNVGGDIQENKAITITTNTVTEITPDDGKDGMAKVTVTTNIPQTSQLYTWYYLGGLPDSDDYVGVIAFFADADMTQQVTLESYGLEIDTSNFTNFKALLIVAEGGLDFAVKYNVNDASNFGQAIQVPRRISLGRENDGDYYVTFCTEPSVDGHDMYYYLWTDSTVQKSLAWALSEYRTADESQS